MRQLNTERDLVGRMRARDGSAVADLASLYGPRIQQLAFRYLRNWEDAEEVAQDVLMKVYRKIEAFRGDAALSSWIYRITFNTAMSRLRNVRASRAAEVAPAEFNYTLQTRSVHGDAGGSLGSATPQTISATNFGVFDATTNVTAAMAMARDSRGMH